MADDASPLSIEQAVSLFRGAPPEAAPEPVETAAPAEETEIEAPPTGDEAASEADEPGDGETEQETEAAAEVDAPQWWDAEAKAKFAKLPADLQAVLAAQEGKREQVTAKAKTEAAEARQAAEREAQGYQQVINHLSNAVPQWIQSFKSEWDGVDWERWAQEDPSAFVAGKARHDAQRQQLSEALQVQQHAQQQQKAAFVREEFAKLSTVAPELAAPETGQAKIQELGTWLLKAGAHPTQLDSMDALSMSIAWKAYQYDQGKAKLAATPRPQTPPQRPLAPSAAPATRTSSQRSIEQHASRLDKSHSVDDGVRLLQALRASRK